MIWLPLILLFSELFIRSRNYLYAFFGGVAVAFNILASHPQYFFYTAIAVVAYFIIRIIQEYGEHRNWKYVGYHASGIFIIYTIGVLLTAIQLLPAFEMIKHSTRQTLSYEWVGQFSFAPENFITLFIPEFFGDSLKTPYWGRYYLWEMSLYAGILPLILCALSSFYNRNKFTKTFLIMALITAILALGKFTPSLKSFMSLRLDSTCFGETPNLYLLLPSPFRYFQALGQNTSEILFLPKKRFLLSFILPVALLL